MLKAGPHTALGARRLARQEQFDKERRQAEARRYGTPPALPAGYEQGCQTETLWRAVWKELAGGKTKTPTELHRQAGTKARTTEKTLYNIMRIMTKAGHITAIKEDGRITGYKRNEQGK